MNGIVSRRLDELEAQGFVVIERALSPEECAAYASRLRWLYEDGYPHGSNDVGTVWFDDVLSVDPGLFRKLIAHQSVRRELSALCGRQLQLRSLRGHYYPGAYKQHWHMDFYGYWDQESEGRIATRGIAVNTTFYFQDGGPEASRVEFVTGGHLTRPVGVERDKVVATEDNDFTKWCDDQPRTVVYPKAGDCLLFFSHIPHRGVKSDAVAERSNVVCHYQVNPFYPGVWFLSETLGDRGRYPVAQKAGH
jgi:Phytanoyl-CoA dioxygenase (PhyH)